MLAIRRARYLRKRYNNIRKYLLCFFHSFLITSRFDFCTDSPTHDLNDGLFTSTLELDWPLSREDLASDIECRVESAAIKNAIVTKFSVDLQGESSSSSSSRQMLSMTQRTGS